MFTSQYSHYLSYGASDQKTVVDLRQVYNGILVPGTVAAFQREGTGGFVLTLSAADAVPYVIDPRSPLFQQQISNPKKSHISLAEILGMPYPPFPAPETFSGELIQTIAQNWVAFNLEYQNKAGGKFNKYAKRLGEDGDGLKLDSASPPHIILPPYFVANSTDDPWWEKSSKIFDATCGAANEVDPSKKCIRVVATEKTTALNDLFESLPHDSELVVWVSGLNEIEAQAYDLVSYCEAISEASERGQKVFALYGGFFSVLLSSLGLKGHSHGIGYGESRHWIELPQSGPPPKRYYVEPFHRYVNQELAEKLWQANVYRCDCPKCSQTTPLLLDYHDIMEHSVYCRHKEIEKWVGLSVNESWDRLFDEQSKTLSALHSAKLARIHKDKAERSMEHITSWLLALGELSTN